MKYLYLPILLLLVIAGCQPEHHQPIPFNEPPPPTNIELHAECPVDSFPLTDHHGEHYGWVYVQADSGMVSVTFVAACGWLIENSYLYLNACEDLPSLPGGVHSFPHSIVGNGSQPQHTYDIVLGEGDSCFCIVPYAEMVHYDPGGHIIHEAEAWAGNTYFEDCNDWYALIDYCLPVCDCGSPHDPNDPVGCTIVPGEFRTQTQGGWGSTPNGGNPGVYQHNNFNATFPNGIIIGCNNTITLTSAQAVTDFLPQGGQPAAISQSYTNPTQALTVLAGQVLALTLSIGFDNYDQQFGSSSTALEDLVIISGLMAGQTVAYALDQGNSALGGCSISYSISDINNVLSQINQNFVDGTQDNGYLECP
ncbi:MAG: hypothetical protein COA57_06245 [Flavobacteriales bacterium]|nr:hypothetical protein [Bacteroidales bacterium AH-315-I05]PCJ86416.1 MAG: hypothetical protein COA57_06245 [Flavobacteriales bacterium]